MDYKEYFDFFGIQHDLPYIIKKGVVPVIISAPHTYEHYREGRTKVAEQGAGVIAFALNKLCGTHCMVKAQVNDDDPNYNDDSPYKKALAQYMIDNGVKYLIDLHELAPSRPTDINPMINGGKNIKGNEVLYLKIKQRFAQSGFTLTEDFPYAGKTDRRLTAYVNKATGLFSLQMELNSKLLYTENPDCRLDDIVDVFCGIVKDILMYDKQKDG